ncbi:MAG: quinoprotein dehydrogenase-associated SoxYZ-like carrier [Roseovarius sp.]
MSALLSHLLPGGPISGAVPTARAGDRSDPFDSGMWPLHREEYLGGPRDWQQDANVLTLAPGAAEDAAHVPLIVDATGIEGQVRRIVVTIDYSPIPLVLTFHPGRALPLLGFGVKYETGSALRASVEREDGSWAMGAAYVAAMGGGCTAPAAAHARPDWQERLGEIRARLWPDTGRLRVSLRHPMDTGLAPGIAAHHLTELDLASGDGATIARLELHEPVEENPALTFLLPAALARQPVTIKARDNLGYRFEGRVEAQS